MSLLNNKEMKIFLHAMELEKEFVAKIDYDLVEVCGSILNKVKNAQPDCDGEFALVTHGYWVDYAARDFHCSECDMRIQKVRNYDGYLIKDLPNFCPNCGARMKNEPIKYSDWKSKSI